MRRPGIPLLHRDILGGVFALGLSPFRCGEEVAERGEGDQRVESDWSSRLTDLEASK